jgi:hypothetical protein
MIITAILKAAISLFCRSFVFDQKTGKIGTIESGSATMVATKKHK